MNENKKYKLPYQHSAAFLQSPCYVLAGAKIFLWV
jgi:hypothetical protein